MSGERILIVDDGKENREFIVEYVLEPNGFQPLVARDGLEGLEVARAERPDLILLDLQMPRMNGMEVLDALSAEQLNIPVILMTFHGSEEIAIEVYRRGVRDYVKKPYTVEEMYNAIERSLAEVRLRREKDDLTDKLVRTNADLNMRLRELNVLYNIGKNVTQLMEIEALMGRIAEAAGELTSCEESSIFLHEGDALHLKALCRQGDGETYIFDEVREDTLAQRALDSRSLVVLSEEEVQAMRRVNPSAPSTGMATPLSIGERVVGVLVAKNFSADARLFTRHDGALLNLLADYAAIAYENASHHHSETTASTPSIDPITELWRGMVSDHMLNEIQQQPNLLDGGRGDRQTASIIHIQLDGHLAFAQKAPPEQMLKLLDDYMTLAADIVLDFDGMIAHTTGDGLTALFNIPFAQPDATLRAANALLALRERVAALHAERGGGLHFKMALHYGTVVLGYLGAAPHLRFGMAGQTVAIAGHLCRQASAGQILLSSVAAQQIEAHLPTQPIEHGDGKILELV